MANRPPAPPKFDDVIFWFEAVTVLSALDWAASLTRPPSRLAIFTDNLNTVQVFESLRSGGGYEELLLRACGILIRSGIDLRVWHVPGERNVMADALSRGLRHVVRLYDPHVVFFDFIPPQATLGDGESI